MNIDREEILDKGNIIAVRVGGGHRSKLNEDAIRSVVNSVPPALIAYNRPDGISSLQASSPNPQKILVIRDMALGDILMVIPPLIKLKEKYPNAEVHFATMSQYMEIAAPFCDRVWDYRQVSPDDYDMVINLILFCEVHKDAATKPRQDILMEGVGIRNYRFSVDEVAFADRYLRDEDKENIRKKMLEFGIDITRPCIAVCTDSSRESKNWHISKFNKLVAMLAAEYSDYSFIFLGARYHELFESDNVFNLSGKLSQREFIAIMNECDMAIVLETGAMHVAGFLRKPFVVICGPSDYRLFAKYYENYSVIYPDIPCYPCNGQCDTNRCIKMIGHKLVAKVVKERLDNINEHFIAVYPTSGDIIDSELLKKYSCNRVGIVSVWAEQGLGYLTRNFRDALQDAYEVFIFGTHPLYAPGHAPPNDEWNVPNLHLSNKTREQMDIQEVLTWVDDNDIDTVIIMEPVGDRIWELVLALRGMDVYTIGIPMVEITRRNEIMNHIFLDKNICLTKQCYDVFVRHGIFNAVYLPYGIPQKNVGISKYLVRKKEIVFYFNAGWADERKNTEAILNAFVKAAQHNDNILLFFHSQSGIENYPPHQQGIIREHPQIIFSCGSLSHDDIMRITKSSDVVVIPTKREGIGILFLEALSLGKPIIAADHPPMNEYVQNNVNGLLCLGNVEDIPPEINESPLVKQINIDEDDLCEKILQIADRKIIDSLSLSSMRIYNHKHSFDNFAVGLKKLLESGNNMRILFIANLLYPKVGGAEQTALLYLSYLVNSGYEVFALCDHGGVAGAVHRWGDVFSQTKVVNYNGVKIIQSSEDIVKCAEYYIEKIEPDIIITQLGASASVLPLAKKLGIPAVMYIHSVAEHFCSYHVWDCNGGKQDLLKCDFNADYCMKEYQQYKKEQFDYADYIIANSNFTQSLVKRFYRRNAYVLRPPVHNIARVSDPYNNQYITMVNSVVDKGVDIFCAVAEMLPQYMFLIVGVNDEGIRQQIVKEKAPAAKIATMPYAEDINKVYSKSKLVLVPSVVQEGYGMVAAEAMYAGVPVITSGRGGLKEVTGDAAIIVEDFTSVEAWVEAIKDILENRSKYDEIRHKCIRRAGELTLDSQGKILLNIIDDIFSDNRGKGK